jgi:hypothetical protein
MASNNVEPRFAVGEDAAQLGPDMQILLQQQDWALDADGMGLTKTFHFKSYFKAVVSAAVLLLTILRQSAVDKFKHSKSRLTESFRSVIRESHRLRKLSEETPPHHDLGKLREKEKAF